MQTATVEGQKVSVGDHVFFKSDIEQSGTIIKIERKYGDYELTLESGWSNGFTGEYIGGNMTTTVMASECWIE
tara:strand:+ start:3516 stop:3734 length:219 start_codon:yes stop_codon:yes gene_type:complete